MQRNSALSRRPIIDLGKKRRCDTDPGRRRDVDGSESVGAKRSWVNALEELNDGA